MRRQKEIADQQNFSKAMNMILAQPETIDLCDDDDFSTTRRYRANKESQPEGTPKNLIFKVPVEKNVVRRFIRQQEAEEKDKFLKPKQKFSNSYEQYLYEKQLRNESLDREINKNRLRNLKATRTTLLSSIYRGEKPKIIMMQYPSPSVNGRDGTDYESYWRMREVA